MTNAKSRQKECSKKLHRFFGIGHISNHKGVITYFPTTLCSDLLDLLGLETKTSSRIRIAGADITVETEY